MIPLRYLLNKSESKFTSRACPQTLFFPFACPSLLFWSFYSIIFSPPDEFNICTSTLFITNSITAVCDWVSNDAFVSDITRVEAENKRKEQTHTKVEEMVLLTRWPAHPGKQFKALCIRFIRSLVCAILKKSRGAEWLVDLSRETHCWCEQHSCCLGKNWRIMAHLPPVWNLSVNKDGHHISITFHCTISAQNRDLGSRAVV